MRHLARTVALVASVTLLLASASAPRQHTFEKARETPASFDRTWAAVIEVFADNNWAIENMERDSGLITTDWMSIGSDSDLADCGGAGLASRRDRHVRFNVFVRETAGGTRVTVNTTMRELRVFDGRELIADCTSTGKVEALIHAMVQQSLASTRHPPGRPLAAGTDGGTCHGNGTCNTGLTCRADHDSHGVIELSGPSFSAPKRSAYSATTSSTCYAASSSTTTRGTWTRRRGAAQRVQAQPAGASRAYV